MKALVRSLKDAATKILRLKPEIPQEAQIALDNIESPSFLTHFLSSNIEADVSDKQKVLETNDGIQRATILLQYMLKDIQLLELKNEIQSKVHSTSTSSSATTSCASRSRCCRMNSATKAPKRKSKN
jgi:ATP-dependent Lon protease